MLYIRTSQCIKRTVGAPHISEKAHHVMLSDVAILAVGPRNAGKRLADARVDVIAVSLLVSALVTVDRLAEERPTARQASATFASAVVLPPGS